ncbi:hypothetical protein B296_00048792 [Ensete ventricosum]|uniref:Uncharacterized protein n=1 Tax=Ensete ventricosum TaxID=4639 RepID=A0A426YDX3_ENSVE|nr:hypothetical protein B296_00048792 [Ensete ventricosum]
MDPEGSHFLGRIVQLQGRYSSRYYETEPAVAMADHGTMTEISFAGRFSSSAIAACFAEVPRSLAPSVAYQCLAICFLPFLFLGVVLLIGVIFNIVPFLKVATVGQMTQIQPIMGFSEAHGPEPHLY